MAKNIVILLDGTSNQISGDRTNVLRLYGSLKRSRSQLVFYQPGVGTFDFSGWWQRLKSKTRIVLGLATGAGIADNVMQPMNSWSGTMDMVAGSIFSASPAAPAPPGCTPASSAISAGQGRAVAAGALCLARLIRWPTSKIR